MGIPMKKAFRRRHSMLAAALIRFGMSVFLLAAIPGHAVEQQPQEPRKVVVPSPNVAIPMAEIVMRAKEVSTLLRTLEIQLAPTAAIEKIGMELPGFSNRINLLLQGTTEILQDQPAIATLQAQRQIWEAMKLHANDWLKVVTERAVQTRNALNPL
jgi:hypothetical protein